MDSTQENYWLGERVKRSQGTAKVKSLKRWQKETPHFLPKAEFLGPEVVIIGESEPQESVNSRGKGLFQEKSKN